MLMYPWLQPRLVVCLWHDRVCRHVRVCVRVCVLIHFRIPVVESKWTIKLVSEPGRLP